MMVINEVVELESGEVTFKATLNPEQVTAMVRWFITMMVQQGAVKLSMDNPEDPARPSVMGDLH